VSVDLFKGLQNQNQLRRSNLSIIASQYQLLKMQEDIALNVANAYLQILFNKENVKVQKQQLTFNESQLQRTTELVNAGQVPQGDLLDSKASVASDKQRLIAAENALLISKLSLAQLLRIEDFQSFDISEEQLDVFDSVIMNESPNAVIEKAKETRTELKIAESNLEIAKKDISIARGAYLPSIVGFYSFNTRAAYFDRIVGFQPNTTNPTSVIGFVDGTGQAVLQPNFSPILGGPLSVWEQFDNNKGQNFGVQMNIPIFNGFATRNNVQRSKVVFERAKLNYDQQNLDLERNVYTAFTDTKAAKESYEAALQTLEARTLSFNYAKDRYEVGLMNVFDFNQAQTLLVNAQSEVLRTKYDYIFRTKILEFYFGIPLIQNN
jgi:outer membrane protein